MSLFGRPRHSRSIFRKTAIIFMVVTLVPIAILGLRSHNIYSSQLDKLVESGVITRQDADAQAHDMELQAITYGGYGLVIALILGYFFASSLVQPIRTLQEGASKIGEGNLDFRVETDTEDELEELATSINTMAESLQSRDSEVNRRNRDLSILYEVAHSMAESREPKELLDNALEKMMEITCSAMGCVLLMSRDDQLEPVISRSTALCQIDEPHQDVFDQAAAAATRSGKLVVLDFEGDLGSGDGTLTVDGSPMAIACVPLKFEGKLQGAICVTGTRSDFPQETLDLISAIGSEVAVSIENSRLFEKLEEQNLELAMATGEIAHLISQAEEQQSFGTRYQNPNLVPCWELKDCQYDQCPAYGSTEDLRCWQVAGTHCGGEVQGVFAQKLGRCERCEVFTAACPDRITRLGETFNNMMAVLERRVEQQEELQRQLYSSSKLAAIGELAAGVAHEINNPLTGILGSALLMKSRKLDQESMDRKLAVIESEALRARDIVRNLLDFARHGGNLDQEPVSVTTLLEHTLFLLRHQADMGAVKVETDLQINLPDINADANQMKQVFLNIIHNAIHAMPDGGTLTISARKSLTAEPRDLEISFADTGIGMDAAAMSRIFDPFYTTKRVGEGTGLGLSVSQRIIAEHGGEIRVASNPGEGSTFTVVMPAAENPAAEDRQNVA